MIAIFVSLCICCLAIAIISIHYSSTNKNIKCYFEGKNYSDKEVFDFMDGSNHCLCDRGEVICTKKTYKSEIETNIVIEGNTQTTSSCASNEIGIGFVIPNTWTCLNDSDIPALILDSDIFYAEFIPYGRGYCEGSINCEITDLFKNNNLHIFHVSDGEYEEILGILNDNHGNWITAVYNIQYKSTEEEDLIELENVLNSIEFLN